MSKGNYCVLIKITDFDHLMGKYHDVNPSMINTWEKKSIYVLCDASLIMEVIEKLSVD